METNNPTPFSNYESTCLAQLKTLISNSAPENELLKKVIDDEAVLKFNLIGRKFDVDAAFETIKRYLEARYIKYAFVYDIQPQSVSHIITSGVGGVLKNKDKDGNWVLIGNLAPLTPSTMTWENLTRAAILSIEHMALRDPENARRGQVLIGDATGFTFSLFRSYAIKQYLASLDIFLNTYPSSVKSIHIVNASRVANYTYSIVKHLIPPKLASRVFMQGKDMTTLHQHVPKEILPKSLGGGLENEEAFDFDMVDQVLQHSQDQRRRSSSLRGGV